MKTLAFLVSLFGSFMIAPLQGQQLLNLGGLAGGEWASGSVINNSDQIVFFSDVPGVGTEGYLYSGGAVTNLGNLGGNFNFPTGINDSGKVIGVTTNSSGSAYGYTFSNGTLSNFSNIGGSINLQGNPNNSGQSVPLGINNSGEIVGQYDGASFSSGLPVGFLYKNGVITQFSTFAPLSINNTGEILGNSASGPEVYFTTNGLITGIPGLGSGASGNAFNDAGQVAGTFYNPSHAQHGFLYSEGQIIDIGSLGGGFSTALGLNNSGAVVGFSSTISGSEDAFVFSITSGMQNLNTLYSSLLVSGTDGEIGFTHLGSSLGINSAGNITGEGTYWDGESLQNENYLLVVSVPEPSTWALLTSSVGMLIFWVRRSSKKMC